MVLLFMIGRTRRATLQLFRATGSIRERPAEPNPPIGREFLLWKFQSCLLPSMTARNSDRRHELSVYNQSCKIALSSRSHARGLDQHARLLNVGRFVSQRHWPTPVLRSATLIASSS